MGWLKTQTSFLTVLDNRKSGIGVLAWRGSGEDPLPSVQMAVSSFMEESKPWCLFLVLQISLGGLRWWSCGKESSCQRRGHRFD